MNSSQESSLLDQSRAAAFLRELAVRPYSPLNRWYTGEWRNRGLGQQPPSDFECWIYFCIVSVGLKNLRIDFRLEPETTQPIAA